MANVELKLNLDKVNSLTRERAKKALTIVGALGVDMVSNQLRKNKSVKTGNLLNSLVYSTESEASAPKADSGGEALDKADDLKLKIGTTIVYAPRVEFGFDGVDSLGRKYSQSEKSFLRAGLYANKNKLSKVFAAAMRF